MVSTGNQVGILNSHCKFFLNFVLCLLDELTFPVSFHSCHALWLTSLSNETATSTGTGKKIGLDWQNNNFARASRFLYISSPSVYDNNMKVPNFTFCRGREHEATTFSFSELWNSLLELNYKKIGQHLTNLTRWNKRDKLWGDPYSLQVTFSLPSPSPSLLLKLPINGARDGWEEPRSNDRNLQKLKIRFSLIASGKKENKTPFTRAKQSARHAKFLAPCWRF